MPHPRGLILIVLGTIFLIGCKPAGNGHSPPVLVAAASDLVKVSRPLSRAFEQGTGLSVVFGFGSSGQLEQQIRHGASFDVYAPAARSFCLALERDGFTDGPDKPYGLGRLVAWSKTLKLQSLDELKDEKIRRIAIANPQYAPYGMAAKQALQAAGLWQAIQPKIVYGETVAHTLEIADTGNAEVALIALALVEDGDDRFLPIDQKLYEPIEQAAVVLKRSTNDRAARIFIDFLDSPEAQKILQQYGFGHL